MKVELRKSTHLEKWDRVENNNEIITKGFIMREPWQVYLMMVVIVALMLLGKKMMFFDGKDKNDPKDKT